MFGTQLVVGFFLMGLAHAFEVDHLSTVSAFVARRPSGYEAMKHGFRWATGHGVSLFILGSIIYLLKISLQPSVQNLLEGAVGVGMILVGAFLLKDAIEDNIHSHSHSHGSLQPHVHTHFHGTLFTHGHHEHPHVKKERGTPFLMGTLHGVAGTGALVIPLLAAAGTNHYSVVLINVIAFSVGVAIAMSCYAGLLGNSIAMKISPLTKYRRFTGGILGLWVFCLGIYWLVKIFNGGTFA